MSSARSSSAPEELNNMIHHQRKISGGSQSSQGSISFHPTPPSTEDDETSSEHSRRVPVPCVTGVNYSTEDILSASFGGTPTVPLHSSFLMNRATATRSSTIHGSVSSVDQTDVIKCSPDPRMSWVRNKKQQKTAAAMAAAAVLSKQRSDSPEPQTTPTGISEGEALDEALPNASRTVKATLRKPVLDASRRLVNKDKAQLLVDGGGEPTLSIQSSTSTPLAVSAGVLNKVFSSLGKVSGTPALSPTYLKSLHSQGLTNMKGLLLLIIVVVGVMNVVHLRASISYVDDIYEELSGRVRVAFLDASTVTSDVIVVAERIKKANTIGRSTGNDDVEKSEELRMTRDELEKLVALRRAKILDLQGIIQDCSLLGEGISSEVASFEELDEHVRNHAVLVREEREERLKTSPRQSDEPPDNSKNVHSPGTDEVLIVKNATNGYGIHFFTHLLSRKTLGSSCSNFSGITGFLCLIATSRPFLVISIVFVVYCIFRRL